MKKDKALISKKEYYDSIDTMPLYNFDRYTATRDYSWFWIGFTGKETKLTDNEIEDVKVIENALMEEYFIRIDDSVLISKMRKLAQIDSLITKYKVVHSLIEIMWSGFPSTIEGEEMRQQFIETLSSAGYEMPVFNSPDGDKEELKKIASKLEALKNKIRIIEAGLKEDGKKESTDINRQLQIATRALDYKFMLKSKEISVGEWIGICKDLKDLSKKN